MKKIKLLIGLLTLTFAFVACQQDEETQLLTNKSTKSVTIEMDAPTVEMQPMSTARNLKNNTTALRFILEVWENNRGAS